MSARLIKPSQYRIAPWKNGGGRTAEIARHPAGDGPYLWRLSQATVESDGPFSLFPGYDRWLAVWRGAGLTLNDRPLEPLSPHRFSGDDDVFCHLTGPGPVEDVGVIFDRARLDVTMSVVKGALQLRPGVHYIFDLESGETTALETASDLTVPKSFLISIFKR